MLPVPCNSCDQNLPESIVSCTGDLTINPSQTDRLFELRAGLLRHHNHHSSPIYTLPLEILSAIFRLTCMSKTVSTGHRDVWQMFNDSPNYRVIILSCVSSRWRQVVHSMPELWSTVTLDSSNRTIWVNNALLQHYLKHTHTLALSIVNYLRVVENWEPITSVLFSPDNFDKITTLRIKGGPVLEWLANISQLTQVQNLCLQYYGASNTQTLLILNLQTMQSLRRVYIDIGRLNSKQVKFPSSVEAVYLYDAHPDARTALLYQCPNLTEACMTSHCSYAPSAFAAPLTLGSLETLRWSVDAGLTNLTSIQNLHLPTLKRLHLYNGHKVQPIPVIAFCNQVSQTLVSLKLNYFAGWRADDFEHLFYSGLPHLQVLKLRFWPLSELIMASRTLTPSDVQLCRNEVPLPCLQHLMMRDVIIDGLDFDRVLDQFHPRPTDPTSCILSLFLEMLRRRVSGESAPFYLDLPALWESQQQRLEWTVELQDEFRQGIRGRDITILQEGKVLEWL